MFGDAVLDGVDVVVRRRGDEADTGRGVARGGDAAVHLFVFHVSCFLLLLSCLLSCLFNDLFMCDALLLFSVFVEVVLFVDAAVRLAAGQLAALARLRALGHLDLQLLRSVNSKLP